MRKVIIEAAINGAVAKKTLNPNIAYSPQEIADDAIATYKAGAAIVHFHARDPQTGKFVFEHGELYTDTYRRARAKSKVMMWPGADFMAMRKGDPDNPDVLYCDPGSVNLVSYDPVTKRTRNEGSVYRVPFDAARRQLEKIDWCAIRQPRVFLGKEMAGVNRSRPQVWKITRELIQKRIPPRYRVLGKSVKHEDGIAGSALQVMHADIRCLDELSGCH